MAPEDTFYRPQGAASKRGAKSSNSSINVYANKSSDPSLAPGTPGVAWNRTGGGKTVATTAGAAGDEAWRTNSARHASGGLIVDPNGYSGNSKGTQGSGNLNRSVTVLGALSYEETQSFAITNKYTFVNQSVRVMGTDGRYLYYKGYYVPKTYAAIKTPDPSPNKYQWNLPPHKWSMPVFPGSDGNFMPKGYQRPPSEDRYRRGRIWWANNDPNLSIADGMSEKSIVAIANNNRFGFQFLWNPTEYTSQISTQMQAVPMAADRFIGGPGAFPATEAISFSIHIDRTNDMAHAASNFSRPTFLIPETIVGRHGTADTQERNILAAQAAAAQALSQSANYVTKDSVRQFIPYYKAKGSFSVDDTPAMMEEKLVDLFQRGTMADLEFLFRATNGYGSGAMKNGKALAWVNSRGVVTSDVGFLVPTLLYVDIGPASYKGYITNLSITHNAFTQDMIPIRTDVNVSFQIVASVGLTSPNSKEGDTTK
jgi:hypothetical protein